MSCQKGNTTRRRPQKYKNSFAFKNTLHDTSHKTKFINNIPVTNVCERCKKKIEWKIKYKKYKPLKAASKCTKCDEKCVKFAYHIMCGPCATKLEVCPKCGEKGNLVVSDEKNEPLKLDRELRLMLKKLPERKRRTFYRFMKRSTEGTCKDSANDGPDEEEEDKDEAEQSKEENDEKELAPLTRDDLLEKLKSLMITKNKDDDSESNFSEEDTDSYYEDESSDDEN